MLILTETDVEEGAALTEKLRDLVAAPAGSASTATPDLSVTISIGIAGGTGQHSSGWTRWSATPTPRCTRPSRSDATRPTSSRSPTRTPASRAPRSRTAGRARAMEIGQQARDAATDMLTSLIAPLPHYRGQPSALIASIVVADGPPARTARRSRSIGCGSRPCSTTSARSRCPQEILDKPAAADVGRMADRRPAPAHRPGHPRAGGRASRTPCRSSCTTTSATRATATRSACAPTRSRSGARIVAIADAYDAMTHDRPYKRAMTHEQAIAELRRHAGDPVRPGARRRCSATCMRRERPAAGSDRAGHHRAGSHRHRAPRPQGRRSTDDGDRGPSPPAPVASSSSGGPTSRPRRSGHRRRDPATGKRPSKRGDRSRLTRSPAVERALVIERASADTRPFRPAC